jgi:hypothetical protein
VYNARFMPDGPIEQWRAFDELQKRTAPPENAVRLWESTELNNVTEAARARRVPTLILHLDQHLRPEHRASRGP